MLGRYIVLIRRGTSPLVQNLPGRTSSWVSTQTRFCPNQCVGRRNESKWIFDTTGNNRHEHRPQLDIHPRPCDPAYCVRGQLQRLRYGLYSRAKSERLLGLSEPLRRFRLFWTLRGYIRQLRRVVVTHKPQNEQYPGPIASKPQECLGFMFTDFVSPLYQARVLTQLTSALIGSCAIRFL